MCKWPIISCSYVPYMYTCHSLIMRTNPCSCTERVVNLQEALVSVAYDKICYSSAGKIDLSSEASVD